MKELNKVYFFPLQILSDSDILMVFISWSVKSTYILA